MLVGIMADSHGDAPATARAVALLVGRGAQKLLHCGDICGEQVLDELAGHDCIFTWGNCDVPSPALRKYVTALGLTCPRQPPRLELYGKRIAVFHGHEPEFRTASALGGLDYLFFGHTHRRSDRTEQGCRWINPGALHRAAVRSVALLDLQTDTLSFLRLDNGEEISFRRP